MNNSLSFAEIQESLKDNTSQLPVMNILVLRNIMLEPISPYLRYLCYQIGFNAKIRFGEYDNILKETIDDSNDFFNNDTDCVLIFMILETISWDLARNFSGLTSVQIESEVIRIQNYISNVIKGIRYKSNAMILWHGFECPVNPTFGVWDSQIENGQIGIIRKLNGILRNKLIEFSNAYFVDMDLCLLRLGVQKFYDLRYWHIGKAPYSREALQEIAFEDFKYIRPLKGRNKKCLVLDCDNTLWGGIIGENEISEIKLGKSYPGAPYYEFQQEIVNLSNRGIIIALCSKNNEKDVWEVFQQHPDMVLKKKHIATAQINWDDKAKNLRKIALDLNIGLDSIVFMDDSEFEINLIREVLPEVEAIHLPIKDALKYRNILSGCGFFDTLTVSAEDKRRGAMYKDEVNRKKLKMQATDLVKYYRSLGMIVHIRFVDDFYIPRVAQQTQKTNQFNLTTRRYNEADISNFIERDDMDVLMLTLKDKFGDLGIVGTCILKYNDQKAIFDTFLLSCRALGRQIEEVFIIQALKLAKKRGCKVAIGEYYATNKNDQVKYFYSEQGFKEMKATASISAKYFEYDLEAPLRNGQNFFKSIISEVE